MDEPTQPADRPPLTAAERLAILNKYDAYPRGDPRRGALLRKHGLHTAQIARWRKRLAQGATSLEDLPPGPAPKPADPLADEIKRLRRENARLQRQLAQATAIMKAQKKLAKQLGLTSDTAPDADS